jgi:hypothetical protein
MEKASTGLIAKSDLMQIALAGIAKGLKPELLIELAGAADIMADIIGGTATDALKAITTALETGKMKGLKPYLDTSLDLASAFGDLESKMTTAEKSQAMYNIVMIAAKRLQAEQSGAVSDTADKMDRIEASYKNANLALGQLCMTVIGGIYDIIQLGVAYSATTAALNNKTTAMKALTGGTSDWTIQGKAATAATMQETKAVAAGTDAMKAAVKPYQDQIELLKNQLKTRNDNTEAVKKSATAHEAAEKSITEAIRKAAYEAETIGQTQYEKDIARIDSEAAKYKKAGVDQVTVAKYVAVEMEGANKKAYEEMAKDARKASDVAISEMEKQIAQGVKLTDEHIKGAEKYKKLVADEYEFASTENERAINKIIADETGKLDEIEDLFYREYISFGDMLDQKERIHVNATKAILEKETENAKKIADINYNLIKDIQGYEEIAYNMRIAQINAQAEADRVAGGNAILIAARVQDETIKAYTDMGYKVDGFFGGVTAGFLEMQRAQTSWGEVGYAGIKTFAADATKELDANLFLFLKGRWGEMGVDFESILDDMLKILTAKIAEMIIQWGLYEAAVYAASLLGLATTSGSVAGDLIASLKPGGGGGGGALGTITSLYGAGKTAYGLYGALAGGAPAAGAIGAGAGVGAGLGGGAGVFATGTGIGAAPFVVDTSLALGAEAGAAGAAAAEAGAGAGAGAGAAVAGVGTAAGVVGAVLAIGYLWGQYWGEDYESKANQYTPDVYAGFQLRQAQALDIQGMMTGGENYDYLTNTPEKVRDVWKSGYDQWFWEMDRYFGQDIPKEIYSTASQAWLKSPLYLGGGYPAQRGLDYVPYDRFPIIAHEGEAVLPKKDAEEWRGGSTRGGVVINVHYNGTIIEEKKAAKDIALMVYPELYRLQNLGH